MVKIKKLIGKFVRLGSFPPRLIFHLDSTKLMPIYRKPYGLTTKDSAGRVLDQLNDFNSEILDEDTASPHHTVYNDEILAAYQTIENMCDYNKPWDIN